MNDIKVSRTVSIELKEYKEALELSKKTGIPINRLLEDLILKGYEETVKIKE